MLWAGPLRVKRRASLYTDRMPGLADSCEVCKRQFQFSLPRCGFCHRTVCGDCSSRMAGAIFCGRQCAHSFFYGGDEDVGEEVDSRGSGEREEDE